MINLTSMVAVGFLALDMRLQHTLDEDPGTLSGGWLIA